MGILRRDDVGCFFYLHNKRNYNIMAEEKKRGHAKFDRQHVVYSIFCDIVNGMTKRDIYQKLAENGYGEPTENIATSTRSALVHDAYNLAKDEREDQIAKQRDLFWNRLTAVYQECMTTGDRQAALKALDMFAKYGAMYEGDNKAIMNVNGTPIDGGGTVTINFGFSNNNNDEP